MTQSHYSLRWKNHQSHILSEFDALLQAETLVDVTLVCDEISVRAHKVVLSACSPFFQKIFAENPCKHPVIVLKDFQGWIIQSIVDFMYKGEISVDHDQLPFLIKAADSLQIRGLSPNENDYVCRKRVNALSPLMDDENELVYSRNSNSFIESLTDRPKFSPPLTMPRRKQAKPRRRSTEPNVQDLTVLKQKSKNDEPENLSLKKESLNLEEFRKSPRPNSPVSPNSMEIESNVTIDKYETLSPQSSLQSFSIGGQMQDYHDYKSPLPYPPIPSSSALTMTSPTYFGLDTTMSLYPSLIDGYRSSFFEMPDMKSTIDHSTVSTLYMKKKIGRPKGQHSAPRGGPPRSWTNAELTQALQHVWNRKLTTSQASRLFGIPYNSLLMYVRGKYGKSLKLEQLRNNCMGAQGSNSDLLTSLNNNNNMTSNNNNNNPVSKPDKQLDPVIQQIRTPHTSDDIANSIFNPFFNNLFPDFPNSSFPGSLNMLNLISPKNEKGTEFNFNMSENGSASNNMESTVAPQSNNPANNNIIQEEVYNSTI